MRKYAIPKYMYILISALLLCFSLGYTYAYFSATAVVEGTVGMHRVQINWIHGAANNVDGLPIYAGSNTIALANGLKRGVHTPIEVHQYSEGEKVYDDNGEPITVALNLGLQNASDVSVYFRIKLTATYENGDDVVDISQYVILESYTGGNYVPITNRGWFYHTDGYYYLGSSAISLTEKYGGDYFIIAGYMYLDPAVGTEMYGKELSLLLKAEAIQSEHDAYVGEWNLPAPVVN